MRYTSIFAALFLTTTAAGAPPTAPSWKAAKAIPGPDGGWDYASVDPILHRLYVARGESVTVIDTARGQVVGSWGQLARGHAAVPLPNGRLLVTSGNDNSVRLLDTASGRELANISVEKKPDAAIYDPKSRRALVINAAAGSIAVIDIDAARVVRIIAVKPGLEFAQLVGRTLFVNNEDANELEVVDIARGIATGAIALTGCDAPSGLGYDGRSGKLVSACDNGKAAIVNAKTRRLTGLVDIGQGPDAVIIDAARRVALIPCGKDGVLDVIALDRNNMTRAARITTEPGARTGALDPSTGIVYLPTARLAPATAPDARRAPLPGTFHVLALQPQ